MATGEIRFGMFAVLGAYCWFCGSLGLWGLVYAVGMSCWYWWCLGK